MPPSSRRRFLRRSSLALLGGAGLSSLSATSGPRRRERIGHGDFQYEVDKTWAVQDPARFPVHHCHEMVMDHQGRLILCTTAPKNNILVFSKDGKVLDSWTHDLPEPHGLSIAGEGSNQTLWLTDSMAGRVLQTDLTGRVIRELELPAGLLPEEAEFKPTETTVAPNGDVYVADGYGTNLILHYDARGTFRQAFGGKEHFDCAHGIALDSRTPEPTLLITSRSANNVQRWSLDGQHLATRELPGLSICRPVIHGDETYFAVIVTKSWWNYDGLVAVLDKNLDVVSLPGGTSPDNQDDFSEVIADGRTFLNPHDVCLDEDGNIYVPQWYSGKTYPVRLLRR